MGKVANSTKTRKAKGRRLQNEVADLLVKIVGMKRENVKVALMGEAGPDVVFHSFCIECTNSEKINVWRKIAQMERNAEIYQNGKAFKVLPMFVFKKNNSMTYAAVELELFLEALVAAAQYKTLVEQIQMANEVVENGGEVIPGPVGNA